MHDNKMLNHLPVRTQIANAAPTFAEFCGALVGLHAARIQSPVAAWIARYPAANSNDVSFIHEMKMNPSTIRVRSVRGTLHYYNPELYSSFHHATLAKRLSICRSLAAGLDESRLNYFKDAIFEHLSSGGLTPKEMEKCIAGSEAQNVRYTRVALKFLWESGQVTLNDVNQNWNKETRVYSLTGDIWKSLRKSETSERACIDEILDAYLRSYGPATLRDIAWWSGLAVGKLRFSLTTLLANGKANCFHSGGREYFDTTGLHVLTESLERIHFFGWEETVFKAYYETRHRYISPKHYDLAFNKIGEIRRTIFRNSKILGIWDVDHDGTPSKYSIFDDTCQRDRTDIEDGFHQHINQFKTKTY